MVQALAEDSPSKVETAFYFFCWIEGAKLLRIYSVEVDNSFMEHIDIVDFGSLQVSFEFERHIKVKLIQIGPIIVEIPSVYDSLSQEIKC